MQSDLKRLLEEDSKLPIYEYQCTQCGHIYEVFQSAKDEPMRKCEQCLGDVTKLISNCSFQLKGTGWYLTDYARKDAGTGERKHKKTNGGGETKSSTESGDTKKESQETKQSE